MAKAKKTAASKKNTSEDQLVETNDNSTNPKIENESEETVKNEENGEVDHQKKRGRPKKSKTISEPERKSSRTPKPVKSEEEESHEKYKEENQKKSPAKRSGSETSSKSPAKKAKEEGKDYEVEAIVGMRTKKGKKEFKIRWKGYKTSDDTWEPEKHLSCQDLIDQYLEEHKDEIEEKEKKPTKKENTPAKPATIKSGRRANTN